MHDDPAELWPVSTATAEPGDVLARGPAGGDAADRRSGIRAARLATVRAEMAALLERPDLAATLVAIRLGVTSRYVRKLLAAEGTTFSAEVHGLRLTQVHARLRDPGHAGRTIADLAFEAGFRDLATFNRQFRRRFGTTPSAVRAATSRLAEPRSAAPAW